MHIVIDPGSATPLYEQLKLRVLAMIRDGELIAGTKLPTVRAWAEELGLAPHTVARAYKELEAVGALEARGRAGTFVSSSGDPTLTAAQRAATEYVATIRELGLGDDLAADLVAAAIRGA